MQIEGKGKKEGATRSHSGRSEFFTVAIYAYPESNMWGPLKRTSRARAFCPSPRVNNKRKLFSRSYIHTHVQRKFAKNAFRAGGSDWAANKWIMLGRKMFRCPRRIFLLSLPPSLSPSYLARNIVTKSVFNGSR